VFEKSKAAGAPQCASWNFSLGGGAKTKAINFSTKIPLERVKRQKSLE
jgi:hypothetical protein